MLDKAAMVGCCARLRTQPHFDRGERAGGAEPGLCCDDDDSGQVRKPEPQGVDPPPGFEVSDDRQNEAANDERDDEDVEREHHICKQLIRRIVEHVRGLK